MCLVRTWLLCCIVLTGCTKSEQKSLPPTIDDTSIYARFIGTDDGYSWRDRTELPEESQYVDIISLDLNKSASSALRDVINKQQGLSDPQAGTSYSSYNAYKLWGVFRNISNFEVPVQSLKQALGASGAELYDNEASLVLNCDYFGGIEKDPDGLYDEIYLVRCFYNGKDIAEALIREGYYEENTLDTKGLGLT